MLLASRCEPWIGHCHNDLLPPLHVDPINRVGINKFLNLSFITIEWHAIDKYHMNVSGVRFEEALKRIWIKSGSQKEIRTESRSNSSKELVQPGDFRGINSSHTEQIPSCDLRVKSFLRVFFCDFQFLQHIICACDRPVWCQRNSEPLFFSSDNVGGFAVQGEIALG